MAIVKFTGFSYLDAGSYLDSTINQEMAFDGLGQIMQSVNNPFSVDVAARNQLVLARGAISTLKGWIISLTEILPGEANLTMTLGFRVNGWNGTSATVGIGLPVGYTTPTNTGIQGSMKRKFSAYDLQPDDYVEIIYDRKAKTLTRLVNAGTNTQVLSDLSETDDKYLLIGTYGTSSRLEFRDFYATITTNGVPETIGPCSVTRSVFPTTLSAGDTKPIGGSDIGATVNNVVNINRVTSAGNVSAAETLSLGMDPLVIKPTKPSGDIRILATRSVVRSRRGEVTLPSKVEVKMIDSSSGAVLNTTTADTTASVYNGGNYSPVVPIETAQDFENIIVSIGSK